MDAVVLGAEREGMAATDRVPAVSVIIPSYNCAAYLDETLRSVWAQTFTDYEVVVVNDGSPDSEELERVLEPYRDRIAYIRQENRGLAAARNAAIRVARAPLIALLDSDDAWEPDYLAVQVGALRRDPGLDVIYPDAVIVGDVPEAGRTYMELCPSRGEVTFERLALQQCNAMVSVTARREAIVRAGMFDESLKVSEDFDLWLRLTRQGGRIAYHRRPLVRYRRRPDSLSSDPIRIARGALRVLDKAERTMALTASETEAVGRARRKLIAQVRLVEGKRALRDGDTQGARAALHEANLVFKRGKIWLALLLLRMAPRLLVRATRLREQLTLKATPSW
jgi:GT2 family glycosyltransferase